MTFLKQSNKQLINQLQSDVDNLDSNEYTATFPLAIDGSKNFTVNLDSKQAALTTSSTVSMGTINFSQMTLISKEIQSVGTLHLNTSNVYFRDSLGSYKTLNNIFDGLRTDVDAKEASLTASSNLNRVGDDFRLIASPILTSMILAGTGDDAVFVKDPNGDLEIDPGDSQKLMIKESVDIEKHLTVNKKLTVEDPSKFKGVVTFDDSLDVTKITIFPETGDMNLIDGQGSSYSLDTRLTAIEAAGGTTYTAGTDIDITSGVISSTVDLSGKQDTLTTSSDIIGDTLDIDIDGSGESTLHKFKVGTVSGGGGDDFYVSHYDKFTSTDYAIRQNQNGFTTINCASGQGINMKVNDVDKIRVNVTGLGIGTTNPQAPLHVSGFKNGTIDVNDTNGGSEFGWTGENRYFWDDKNANVGVYIESNTVMNHLWVGYSITFSSDSRIKKDIVDIDDEIALTQLRGLRPKTYKYIDESRGTSTVIGYIAQDIAQDLPHAHSTGRGEVQNIHALATVNGDTLEFSDEVVLELDENGIIYPTLVVMGWDHHIKQEVQIVSQIDPHTLQISGTIERIDDNDTVFVVGQIVENFNRIKKDYISTVTTAAVQELDRQLTAEKAKTATLEAKVATLESEMATTIARLDALTYGYT